MPRAARNTWRGADPAGGSPTQETPTPGLHHPAPKHCQRGTPKPAPRPKNPGSLQPCAQGCSRPKAALMAGAGTSGTRGRGRDISEAQRGWRRESSPSSPRARRGAPGAVPAAWERRGAAGSPGTPSRTLAQAPQGWYRLRGAAGSGPAPPQLRAPASSTLCLFLKPRASISRRFCPCGIESKDTGKKNINKNFAK